MVPLIEVDLHRDLLSSHEKLDKYVVPDGPTPVSPRVYTQVYIVIVEQNGKSRQRTLDVTRTGSNRLHVIL
jgi:hypothetical protein